MASKKRSNAVAGSEKAMRPNVKVAGDVDPQERIEITRLLRPRNATREVQTRAAHTFEMRKRLSELLQQTGTRARLSADWHELADFFISFGYAISQSGEKRLQTEVHHSQAGQSERWDGIATQQLLNTTRSRSPSNCI